MRNSRAAHPARTFRFTPELGARLRELREGVGLSLVELAHLMGRTPGYQAHLGRLEAGRIPFPTLALVADYLRACRASFEELLPILAEYTNKPLVRQTRIEERVSAELAGLGGREAYRLVKYDRERGEELGPDARVRAAAKQARAVGERRLLEAMLTSEVNRLGVKPTASVRVAAYDYARMVWKALRLTERSQKAEVITLKSEVGAEEEEAGARRRTDGDSSQEAEAKAQESKPGRRRGRPRKTCDQRLKEARARILKLAPDILPARALDRIRDEVVRLFEGVRRFEEEEAGPGQITD